MIYKYWFTIVIYTTLLAIIPMKTIAFSGDIIVVLNEGKIGDQNQLYGITDAVIAKLPKQSIQYIHSTQVMSLKHILDSECKQNNNTILLTSGLDGANIINDVYRQSCPNIFIVNTTHLIFDEHNQILGKANLIALPTSSIDPNFLQAAEQKGSKIIQTIGVAHNSTPAILEQDYQKHQKDFSWLAQKPKIAMIILGGDAPAKDNKIAIYTAAEAKKAAKYIGEFCKNGQYSLMIFNGARTGLYDPQTFKKREWVHQGKQIDPVTTAFIEELAKYMDKSAFKLYDFNHKVGGFYKAGLWIIKKAKDGKCFLPGESTSMISEAIDNLNGRTVIIQNNAMNKTHKKHIMSEAAAGNTVILDQNFQEIKIPITSHQYSRKSAATEIAEAILNFAN